MTKSLTGANEQAQPIDFTRFLPTSYCVRKTGRKSLTGAFHSLTGAFHSLTGAFHSLPGANFPQLQRLEALKYKGYRPAGTFGILS